MADAATPRRTVSTQGTVTVRQRPAVLLMKVRLRATEPTLELGLTRLKAQGEAARQWLSRLGAERVACGEPHFDEQIDKDPLTKARAATAKAIGRHLPGAAAAGDGKRGVNVVVTAQWPIAALSAEQTLVLVDRLRFEAAADSGTAEAAEEPPAWATPQEQMQALMAQMQQPPVDDGTPQFLFIARLDDEQLERAVAEAFARAVRNAERLARAAGLRLGPLTALNHVYGRPGEGRADLLLERQRCAALLASMAVELGEHDLVSEDLRAAEFVVTVHATHTLDRAP